MDLLTTPERASELRAGISFWRSVDLTPPQLADLELLTSGGFAPLRGFLTRADAESVLRTGHLVDGTVWPVPVVLEVPEPVARAERGPEPLVLRDPEGIPLAVMHPSDVWDGRPRSDAASPSPKRFYVGGPVEALASPSNVMPAGFARTPRDTRARIEAAGWSRVLAFAADGWLHRGELALVQRLLGRLDAALLLLSVVPPSLSDDMPSVLRRVRAHAAFARQLPNDRVVTSLVWRAVALSTSDNDLLDERTRQSLLLAIVARNFGATHTLVLTKDASDERRARALTDAASEIGIDVVVEAAPKYSRRHRAVVLDPRTARVEANDQRATPEVLVDGQDLEREAIAGGETWFTLPDVAGALIGQSADPAASGFAVFFTGLSGAGKSTIASQLVAMLVERGHRVTLLDGDRVRKLLSSELGFSREHRDLNVRRIGYVASEIARHGGIAVCAPIAPYEAVRQEVRGMVEAFGAFVLVYVSTPLEVCEQRDVKGLYAKARAGLLQEFTGISDPYEPPRNPELAIDTTEMTSVAAAERVMAYLEERELLPRQG